MSPISPAQDDLDEVLAQWRRERPDLDLSPMGVLARVLRISMFAGSAVGLALQRHGLRSGEFDVLSALRRSGSPYTLTPSTLADALMMSRAGMTSRLDRLEDEGFVMRSLDRDDRRSFRVTLTDQGRQAIDDTMTEHAALLHQLVAPLSRADLRDLETSLRALLLHLTSLAASNSPTK